MAADITVEKSAWSFEAIHCKNCSFVKIGLKNKKCCDIIINALRRGENEYAPLAQLVEQLTLNQWVPGSNP